jgi:hypothetical protein
MLDWRKYETFLERQEFKSMNFTKIEALVEKRTKEVTLLSILSQYSPINIFPTFLCKTLLILSHLCLYQKGLTQKGRENVNWTILAQDKN